MKKILLLLVVSCFLISCGGDDSEPGDWDDTCYDCESVCEGTTGDVAAACSSKCEECQGYSDCFGWMDGHYDGMSNAMADWTSATCEPNNMPSGSF